MHIMEARWSSFLDETIASFERSGTARACFTASAPMTFTKNGVLIALCAVNRLGMKVTCKSGGRKASGTPSLYAKRRLEEKRWRALMHPWRADRVGSSAHGGVAFERAALQASNFYIRRLCYAAQANKQISLARQGYASFYAVAETSLDLHSILVSSAGIDGWAAFAEHILQKQSVYGCECTQECDAAAHNAGEEPKQFRTQLAARTALSSMRGGGRSNPSTETPTASQVPGSDRKDSSKVGPLSVQPIRFQPGTYPVKDNDPSFKHWKTVDNKIRMIRYGIRKILETNVSSSFES